MLVEQSHGQAGKRSFSASWVGLDVLEAVCLLGVAQLIRRRPAAIAWIVLLAAVGTLGGYGLIAAVRGGQIALT